MDREGGRAERWDPTTSSVTTGDDADRGQCRVMSLRFERDHVLEEIIFGWCREENKYGVEDLLIETKATGMRAMSAADEWWWSKYGAGLWEEDMPKIVTWNHEPEEYKDDLVI